MTPTDSQPSPSPTPPRPAGLIRRALRRHRRGILIAWVLGTLVACGVAYLTVKPKYRAFTLIRAEPAVTDLFNTKTSKPDDLDLYLRTQVHLITSPNILTAAGTNPKAAVLERIQMAGDVVLELQKVITVGVVPGTYLIQVEMISESGYEAATIVNAVVDAFIEANSEWSDGMTRQQIKNLEQYQIDLKNQTDELERKWKTLVAKGDLDIPPQGAVRGVEGADNQAITIEEYRQVRHDLNAVEMELVQAQAWLTTARENAKKAGQAADPAEARVALDRMVEREFKIDPEVSQLQSDIKKAEAKLGDANRLKLVSSDPAAVAAKRKLDSLVAQYAALWDHKSQSIREMIEAGEPGRPDQDIREADANVKKLQARQSALKVMYAKLDVKNRNRGTDAVEIALIQDGRQTIRGMQDAVTKRLEQLRYEAKGEARLRPVNPNGAMVPNRPISDKRMTVLLSAPFLVLFASLAFFIGFEAVAGSSPLKPKVEPMGEV